MKLKSGRFVFCRDFSSSAVDSSAMPPSLSKPIRHYRQNSPFSQEQASWIILKFSELKSLIEVRRAFRQKFFPKHPRYVPAHPAFLRLVERFETAGAVHLLTAQGPGSNPDGDVSRVRWYFDDNPDCHVRGAAEQSGMSFGNVWTSARTSCGGWHATPGAVPSCAAQNRVPTL